MEFCNSQYDIFHFVRDVKVSFCSHFHLRRVERGEKSPVPAVAWGWALYSLQRHVTGIVENPTVGDITVHITPHDRKSEQNIDHNGRIFKPVSCFFWRDVFRRLISHCCSRRFFHLLPSSCHPAAVIWANFFLLSDFCTFICLKSYVSSVKPFSHHDSALNHLSNKIIYKQIYILHPNFLWS